MQSSQVSHEAKDITDVQWIKMQIYNTVHVYNIYSTVCCSIQYSGVRRGRYVVDFLAIPLHTV